MPPRAVVASFRPRGPLAYREAPARREAGSDQHGDSSEMIEEATRPAHQALGSAVLRSNGRVTVRDRGVLAGPGMDAVVRDAVFGSGDVRDQARWLIWEMAQSAGVRPSSIHDLYLARGRGAVSGFTVPAINVRGMAYDTARVISTHSS